VYFYELHEGDDDLFTDALLVHELEFDDAHFLELVQESRQRVLESFREDTLVEAVAHDLERQHGFTFVDDARLTAAVNVSASEDGTFLADLADEPAGDDDSGEDIFRTLLVDIDPNEMN
jgi:hypothetical protein